MAAPSHRSLNRRHWTLSGISIALLVVTFLTMLAVRFYANRLANAAPDQATALIVDNSDGSLRISVRAPKSRPRGADALCRAFPTGGGRQAAAGVNALPESDLPQFLEAFQNGF